MSKIILPLPRLPHEPLIMGPHALRVEAQRREAMEKLVRAIVMVSQILGLILVVAEVGIYLARSIAALSVFAPTLDAEILKLLGWVLVLSAGEKVCQWGATPFHDN